MERAIKDICRLPDTKLFKEVATGITYVMEMVERLDLATEKLCKEGEYHPARILSYLAEEEAAKVFILMDAVRCPPNQEKERSRTLDYFYDHLAKGIYAEICKWQPADFAEIAKGVESLREEYYLDGPMDVDWIFPNRIKQRREDELYVGYLRDDSDVAGQGECRWTYPRKDNLIDAMLGRSTPWVIEMARSLHQVGATTLTGLAVVAEVWRPVAVVPEMRFDRLEQINLRVLETMRKQDILMDAPDEIIRRIQVRWPFPLWPLDLRIKKIDKNELREVRKQRF